MLRERVRALEAQLTQYMQAHDSTHAREREADTRLATALDQKFDKTNEWRSFVETQQASFLRSEDYNERHKALENTISQTQKDLSKYIQVGEYNERHKALELQIFSVVKDQSNSEAQLRESLTQLRESTILAASNMRENDIRPLNEQISSLQGKMAVFLGLTGITGAIIGAIVGAFVGHLVAGVHP